MRTNPYPAPVDRLLTLDEPQLKEWLDYSALGIGPEHVPELVRMALDEDLYAQGLGELEGWAYVHAWRALAQLRAVEAAPELLGLFECREGDEAVLEELPDTLGRMGPAVLPALAAYLAEPRHRETRALAAEAIARLAVHSPEAREECIAALAAQLAGFAEQEKDLNAFLINNLVRLDARAEAPLIQRVYDTRAVSVAIAGPWDSVRRSLGAEPAPAAIRMEEGAPAAAAPARGQAGRAPLQPEGGGQAIGGAPSPGGARAAAAPPAGRDGAAAPPRPAASSKASAYPAPKGGRGKARHKHGGKKKR